MTCKEHEWAVFSTALDQGWLMLQCVNCGLHATVDDPSEEEWSQAFHAPLRPYRWQDESRVVIHKEHRTDRRFVQKKPPGTTKCPCYAELGVLEPGGYARPRGDGTRCGLRKVTWYRSQR